MAVRIHPHARERMHERGATEAEVTTTVELGEQFPVKFERTGFDATSDLTKNGVESSITPSRSKPMPSRKVPPGW